MVRLLYLASVCGVKTHDPDMIRCTAFAERSVGGGDNLMRALLALHHERKEQ